MQPKRGLASRLHVPMPCWMPNSPSRKRLRADNAASSNSKALQIACFNNGHPAREPHKFKFRVVSGRPLCCALRTSLGHRARSEKCQQLTHAPQHLADRQPGGAKRFGLTRSEDATDHRSLRQFRSICSSAGSRCVHVRLSLLVAGETRPRVSPEGSRGLTGFESTAIVRPTSA
jgi:hypothetical protein